MSAAAARFKAAEDGANWFLAQQCLKSLQSIKADIDGMEAMDFAAERDDVEAKIGQIDSKISALSAPSKVPDAATGSVRNQRPMVSQQAMDSAHGVVDGVGVDVDDEEEATESELLRRYKMYKFAAKKAKDDGDIATAKRFILEYKAIQRAIGEHRDGVTIWTSDIPPVLEDHLWRIQSAHTSKIKASDVGPKKELPSVTAVSRQSMTARRPPSTSKRK